MLLLPGEKLTESQRNIHDVIARGAAEQLT